jgi:hypothetical protein
MVRPPERLALSVQAPFSFAISLSSFAKSRREQIVCATPQTSVQEFNAYQMDLSLSLDSCSVAQNSLQRIQKFPARPSREFARKSLNSCENHWSDQVLAAAIS